MKKLQISFLIILLFASLGCGKERWSGYVFPDRNNLLVNRTVGEFQSLEACKDASMETLQEMNATQNGYYECGKNCKSGSDYYLRDCEKTVRDPNYYNK